MMNSPHAISSFCFCRDLKDVGRAPPGREQVLEDAAGTDSSSSEESRGLLIAKALCCVGVLIEMWSETRSGEGQVGRVVKLVNNRDID